MTEREAWLELADVWSTPVRDADSVRCHVLIGWRWCYGLCESLRCLRGLDPKVLAKMLRVAHGRGRKPWAYRWARTADGARRRAAFCRRQAARCA